ncbi:tetratricopeptide repeat protein [Streptomyces prasinosporus]|uniref:transglutaminase family protein n=1 Tax=Streptomyces prasinosporus TaxID=68256 RepID=UPI0031F05A41
MALRDLLGERYGFHGLPHDYRRLESSLLHEVLRRRRGLPILLSVVWIEVARRAGRAGVRAWRCPGTSSWASATRAGRAPGRCWPTPFDGGRVLTGPDAELLVAGATGGPLEPSMLAPAGTLEVVARILNNVRAWAATRPERTDVGLWALDVALLLPSRPARLRYERAQLLVQRGEFTAGAAELEAYADVVAAVDQAAADRIRGEALAARALLN